MSKRIDNIPEALSIKINQKVYQADREKIDIVKLSYGEAFFDIPKFSFSKLDFNKGYHYSDSRGIFELRVKLSKYYENNYGSSFNPINEVLITTGSKVAIYMSMLAITDPGDEIIMIEPAWLSYKEQASLCGTKIINFPYFSKISNIKKIITKKTKIIIINNPNNPSGKLYSKIELNFLYQLCKKNHIHLLVDEAYSDYVIDKKFYSAVNLSKNKKNLIIINSISKNFGMSGWRVGYVVSNNIIIDKILKLNQHLITCPPTILLMYLNMYFEKILTFATPQIKFLVKKRKDIINYLDKINLRYLKGSSTFYIFIDITNKKYDDISFSEELFNSHRIAVVPGSAYGKSTSNFIRISIGVEDIIRIKESLKIIKKLKEDNE